MNRIKFILLVVVFFFASAAVVHAQTPNGKLYFAPESLEVNNNSTFTNEIYVDTDGSDVGGVGAIVTFNNVFLEAVSVEPGVIFDDYPLAAIDNDSGRISISGISGSKDHLYNGKDLFAKVTWQAKKTGTTDVSFDFTPGRTTDSNIAVTFGTGDILSEIAPQHVSILVSGAAESTETTTDATAETVSSPSIIERALNAIFGNREATVDPYAPIARQEPKTDIASSEGTGSFVSEAPVAPRNNNLLLALAAALFVALGLGVTIYAISVNRRKKNAIVITEDLGNNKPPAPPIMGL